MIRLVFSLLLCAHSFSTQAQRTDVRLDLDELTRRLAATRRPLGESGATLTEADAVTVPLPWFGDRAAVVAVVEASQFAPELQARYPEIRSYRIVGGAGPITGGRLSVSPAGASGLFYDAAGHPVSLLPGADGAGGAGRVHTLQRLGASALDFACGTDGLPSPGPAPLAEVGAVANSCFRVGDELRAFRIALTNSGEFAQLNGGTVASVNAAFNARLGELNAVYERGAAITFELIAGNDVLVQLDPATDSYPLPDESGRAVDETGVFINSRLASADFDIGHGLHEKTEGGISGVAYVGVVCQEDYKARGYSTLYNDRPLAIMPHEVGHQFDCNHTNFGCSNTGEQRYEPGEGVTVMGTGAGCTNADRVGSDIGNLFHAGSLAAINAHVRDVDCAAARASGNLAPTSEANPGDATYTIPANTPFVLGGSGSDPNDPAAQLTYSWVSFDTDDGTSLTPARSANSTVAPLFRSFAPSASPVRYFPQLTTILNGPADPVTGETLPAVSRSLNFRLTVRDNHPGAGGTACDQIAVQVADTGDPFRVTSQNAATSIEANGGRTASVTWDVAGTDAGDCSWARSRGRSHSPATPSNVITTGSIVPSALKYNSSRQVTRWSRSSLGIGRRWYTIR